MSLALAMLASVASVADAGKYPWRRRSPEGLRPNFIDVARVSPSDWPAEPSMPQTVAPARFAKALRALCGSIPPSRARDFTSWMLDSAETFGEDPFLIGALAYQQTHCRPNLAEGETVGVTALPYRMYASNFSGRLLKYSVYRDGRLAPKEKRLERFGFHAARLENSESNIYFAAAVLSMWREQKDALVRGFPQVPHRHHVSHFIWGDKVRSQREEDRILTHRRRLLGYYGAEVSEPTVEYEGVTLVSPLHGAPRVVTSGLGTDRDGGARSHRGVDLDSEPGEPVRVVADGRVLFAGVDLPGRMVHRQLKPGEYDSVPRRALAVGGRFVCVLHDMPSDGYLRTCYMHLEDVRVQAGQRLRQGEVIGTVGRTGMKTSAAHLHFEMHGKDGPMDGAEAMGDVIIGVPNPPPAYPPPTMTASLRGDD